MSQIIQLPIRVEFATHRRQWEVCEARLAGYARDFYPKPAPSSMAIRTSIPAGPLNPNIALYVVRGGILSALYREEQEPVYTAFFGTGELLQERFAPGGEIAQSDETYEPFEVVVSFDDSPSEPQSRDPWKMRDEFVELENTSDQLAKFLTKWGDWNYNPMHQINRPYEQGLSRIQDERQSPLYVLPEAVWQRQAFYRNAMTQKPARWLAEHARLPSPRRIERVPYFELTDRLCSSAIETTITLDHLRRVEHRVCARTDCGALFKVQSAHGQTYCSQPCAHTEHMRRARKAERQQIKRQAKGV